VNVPLSAQILHSDLEIDCPDCGYPIWVLWSEIVAQTTIRCPCCRVRIRLVDRDGDAQNLGANLDRQINDLLKGMFR
jgi:DNA-directed RNA polymerase subunit RPC12/RpoP